MNLKTRRQLFFSLVFVFIICGIAVIFYSRGFRVNISNCRLPISELKNCRILFQKTGAIFIATKPKNVIIKVNGETIQDKSGFLQSGTLITELLPKNYNIQIYKNDYFPWQKTLKVTSGLVAEAKNIILVKKELAALPVNASRLRGGVIQEVANDGNKFIIKDSQTDTYYLYDSGDFSVASNINLKLKNGDGGKSILKISFHPFLPGKFIVESEKGFYILDGSSGELEKISETKPNIWTIKNSGIYYIRQGREIESKSVSYAIYYFSLITKNENWLIGLNKSFPFILPFRKIEVSGTEDKIGIWDQMKNLSVIDLGSRKVTNKFTGIEDFSFAPDSQKLAFIKDGGSLAILFLKEWLGDSNKKEGEISAVSEANADGLLWYNDSAHLLVSRSNTLYFLEMDDRTPVNNYPLLREINSFYYFAPDNLIYFLKDKNLFRLKIEQ